MARTSNPRLGGNMAAFIVVGLTFICLMAAAGLRSAPGVLMVPLETAFGWSRASVSLAAGVGILLYGLTGPFAAALMQTYGIRRVVMVALGLMSAGTGLSVFMRESWQYVVTWGVIAGLGSGTVAMVLGATVVNRWFVARRGLIMGLLTASAASGTLVFLPAMAALAENSGWRAVAIAVACVTGTLAPAVWFFLPEWPDDIGQKPYGAPEDYVRPAPPAQSPMANTFAVLRRAAANRTFWLLFSGFFICGLTTNGLVGTHLIAMCSDHGMAPTGAAGLLAVMGLFDLIGTVASGWLTDRFDSRKLLFIYYLLRGISLVVLPYTDFSLTTLGVFAVFYGLDWVATVPPTVRLATEAFGDQDGPIVFGWIAAGHQIGAATAAIAAGILRTINGQYLEAFVFAGLLAILAAFASMAIRRQVIPA